MPRPFANSPHHTGDIDAGHLLGIQIGQTTGDGGLPQMKYITVSQLRTFVREGLGSAFNYRGKYSSALPDDLATGDVFYASDTFTEDDETFTEGHLYAYASDGSWSDISNIMTQYATQQEVDDLTSDVAGIDSRLTAAETKIDAMDNGIVFKGSTTRAQLPSADSSNVGWEYYLTDESTFVISDGTSWLSVSTSITQSITPGDITHAPSSDAVYQALENEKQDREEQMESLGLSVVNGMLHITYSI